MSYYYSVDEKRMNIVELATATGLSRRAVRFYIQKLAVQGISAKTTQRLLHDQLSLELSLRVIQLIRSDAEKSKSLVA